MRKDNTERYINLLRESGVEFHRAWNIAKDLNRAFNATESQAVIKQFIARKWTAWEMQMMTFNRAWKKSPEPESVFTQEDELLSLGCEVGLARKSLAVFYGKLKPADLMEKFHILSDLDVDLALTVAYNETSLLADSAELKRRLLQGRSLGLGTGDILDTFKEKSLRNYGVNLERIKNRRRGAYSKIWTLKREIAALKKEAAECKQRAKTVQALINLTKKDGATTENTDGPT